MPHCYIIHSTRLDSFYVGACHVDLRQRINNHNSGKYKNSYAKKANDWSIFISFEVKDYAHAIRIEKKIKSMKSKVYIKNLKKYPELYNKLIIKTKSI